MCQENGQASESLSFISGRFAHRYIHTPDSVGTHKSPRLEFRLPRRFHTRNLERYRSLPSVTRAPIHNTHMYTHMYL